MGRLQDIDWEYAALSTVGVICMIFAIAIVAFACVYFPARFNAAMSSRYWIETNNSTYYTDAYSEKDGCITFTAKVYDRDIKQCGFYSISDMK